MLRRDRTLTGAAGLAILRPAQASAAGWDDWNVSPLTGTIGELNYSIGGQAYGSAYTADQPSSAGLDTSAVPDAYTLTCPGPFAATAPEIIVTVSPGSASAPASASR